MYREIKNCRLCNSRKIVSVLNLGDQYLTGVFPSDNKRKITKGPLELVLCENCGLLQLKHSFSLNEMYGDNYGYRSSLNSSMVNHLRSKIKKLETFCNLKANDIVIDIGSNDATSLKSYETKSLVRLGVDPTGQKFKKFYTQDIKLIPDFFPSEAFRKSFRK